MKEDKQLEEIKKMFEEFSVVQKQSFIWLLKNKGDIELLTNGKQVDSTILKDMLNRFWDKGATEAAAIALYKLQKFNEATENKNNKQEN